MPYYSQTDWVDMTEMAGWVSPKYAAVAREIHPDIIKSFRDNYVLEFLGLPEQHHSPHYCGYC
jgi:hypothetical protein